MAYELLILIRMRRDLKFISAVKIKNIFFLFLLFYCFRQAVAVSLRCEDHYSLKSIAPLIIKNDDFNQTKFSSNIKIINEQKLSETLHLNSQQFHLYSKKVIEAPDEAFIEWSIKETIESLQLEAIQTDDIYVFAEGKEFVKYFKWNDDKEVFVDLTTEKKMEEQIFAAIFYVLSPHSHGQFKYLQSQSGEIYKKFWRFNFDRKFWESQNLPPPFFSHYEVAYVLEKIKKFPLERIIQSARQFGLSSLETEGIRSRFLTLLKSLKMSDGVFKSSVEVIRTIRAERLKNKKIFKPQVISEIRQKLTSRFLKDFQNHSQFKNFEDFKNQIMAIPEYSAIVSEIFKNGKIYLRLPSSDRIGILTNGIRNLFETRQSTFLEGPFDDNPYVKLRESIESESLGISIDQFKTDIPNYFRAKSFFFSLTEPTWTYSSTMGNDIYILDYKKILRQHQQGKIVLSLTLGDSGRASAGWQGRAIPIDLFPYFAAPFIFQVRKETNSYDRMSAPIYRKNVFGMKDVLPSFLNGLENKFDLYASETSSMIDEFNKNKMTTDYIEAQIFGEVSPELIVRLLSAGNSELMTDTLKEAFQKQGIQVHLNF